MFDMPRDNNDTLNANSSNRMGRLSPGLNTPYQVCALHTELRTNFETPISDDSRYDKAEPKEYSSAQKTIFQNQTPNPYLYLNLILNSHHLI